MLRRRSIAFLGLACVLAPGAAAAAGDMPRPIEVENLEALPIGFVNVRSRTP